MSRFQILCLSGGGYRGLYSASVLRQLEEVAGRPISECFDLLSGTSVGGILALGLAAGKPAAELERFFLDQGPSIFSARPLPNSRLGRRLRVLRRLASHPHKPFFGQDALRSAVEETVGKDLRLGDLLRPVLIPSVNLSKGKPQVFKTAHHPTFMRDWRLKVADIALATSAAPGYFPVHQIDGELFADGGLYANSPDSLALHEATHFFKRTLEEVHILSIGTTTTSFSWSSATGTELGWINWAFEQRLINAMMAAQQINVDYMIRHALSDRYIRLDSEPSCEQADQIGLDVASEVARQDLLAMANATVRHAVANERLAQMLAHNPDTPKFYHGAA